MKNLIFTLFLVFSFVSFNSIALAATDIFIMPDSGNVYQEFTISLMLDTNGDDISAADITLSFSEDLVFLGGEAGDITGCTPAFIEGSNDVSVICFIPPGTTFNGEGTLATLTFSSEILGTTEINIEDVDFAGSTPGSTSNANLTVIESISNVGGDSPTLPQTSKLPTLIIIGVGFVLLGSLSFIFKGRIIKNKFVRTVVITSD